MHTYLEYDAFELAGEIVASFNEKITLTTDFAWMRILPKFYFRNETFSGINFPCNCLDYMHRNVEAHRNP